MLAKHAQTQRLIGVPAAADMLGLSKRMVYVLASRGSLQTCRIGKRVLIPLDEIDRFIVEHTVNILELRP